MSWNHKVDDSRKDIDRQMVCVCVLVSLSEYPVSSYAGAQYNDGIKGKDKKVKGSKKQKTSPSNYRPAHGV